MQQPSQHPLQQPIQQPAPPYAAPSGSSSGSSSPSSDGEQAGFAHDDALVGPVSPGAALVRLLQAEARLPESLSDLRPEIQAAREDLARAVASAPEVQGALSCAQSVLKRLFERVMEGDGAAEMCVVLGFPPAKMKGDEVGAVDVSTIVVTHTRPLKQVLSTIAFADAANATGYRLFETKVLPNGEDYEDSTVANYLPTFTRVRLAAGEHRFRIESRNPYARTLSEFFTFRVPRP